MLSKFLFLWIVLSSTIGMYLYYFEKDRKDLIVKFIKKALICLFIGGTIIFVGTFLNSVQFN